MDELENKTDEELREIVKRGVNLLPHIPQSESNRAKRILEDRLYVKMSNQSSAVNYNGTFNFHGGNNIIGPDGKIESTITIKQMLDELGKIIEENAPDTPEKRNILKSLKDFIVNEKSGEFLGSFFGNFFKSLHK